MPIWNKFCWTLALTLLVLWSSEALSTDLEKKVIKTRLDNGMTILMLERKFSPTVSLYIRHRVGAVDEFKGQTGAAHFLEHMMFKGTTSIGTKDFTAEVQLIEEIESTGQALDDERRKNEKADAKQIEKLSAQLKELQTKHRHYYVSNEIDRLYTENGGLGMNASTGQDVTTYFVSLPANKIELWARVEADRLLNPVFREFYTERDVILEERRQRIESNPDGKLYQAFMREAYRVHPYGLPIIGLLEDIRYLNPAAVRDMHRRYLSPDHTVIAVVGDIDPQVTLEIIKRYFGRIPEKRSQAFSVPDEPRQKKERKIEIIFDAEPSIIIGYHKPNAPSKEDYALDVLETLMAHGRTSRLYARLVVQQQMAERISIQNGVPAARYPNLFAIFARPRDPHTSDELLGAIFREIEIIRKTPVTEKELSKAKKKIKMDYMKNLDSNDELASILSYYELLLGDYRYFSRYISQIDQVTPADIQKAAVKYLKAENRTIAVLKKKTLDESNTDHRDE